MTDAATVTLAEFLLARIGEDEVRGRILAERRQNRRQWSEETWDGAQSDYPDSPARVLAECEAKRLIVEYAIENVGMFDPSGSAFDHGQALGLAVVLRYLAQPYASHRDYRQEWKP